MGLFKVIPILGEWYSIKNRVPSTILVAGFVNMIYLIKTRQNLRTRILLLKYPVSKWTNFHINMIKYIHQCFVWRQPHWKKIILLCIFVYIECMALRWNKNVRNYRNKRKIRNWVYSVYCHPAQKSSVSNLYVASWFNQANIWIKLLHTNHVFIESACCLFYK